MNPCIFSICEIFQQNWNNENGNAITNGEEGNGNAEIHCQNKHGNKGMSHLRYLTTQL
jgi:hypothetical protein